LVGMETNALELGKSDNPSLRRIGKSDSSKRWKNLSRKSIGVVVTPLSVHVSWMSLQADNSSV